MKFNPIKRILYTEKGEVIRKLNCPYKVSFSGPVVEIPTTDHICDICNGEIVDTSTMAEEELLKLSQSANNLCLKIDPAQRNVRIVYIK